MGALDALINLAVDQNRRGNISDIMDGLNDGSIQQNQALIKLAQTTGSEDDLKNGIAQMTINRAQGLNPDGTPIQAAGPMPDGEAGYNVPATPQSIPTFGTNLGQNLGNPDTYIKGRTGQAVTGALAQLPAGADPMSQFLAAGAAAYKATGDQTYLKGVMETVLNAQKTQSETNKNNASAAKDQSQTVITPTGGALTPGQKAVDDEFAKTFTGFNSTGGANNTNVAMAQIDKVIAGLQNGLNIQTGQPPVDPTVAPIHTGLDTDRAAFDNSGHPTLIGKAVDPDLIAAKSNVDGAVLPLLKPLFGSRVTNFDASSSMSSMGLNPTATTQENIAKLQSLKSRLAGAQDELYKAGDYFTKNGTLAGYGGATAENQQSGGNITQSQPPSQQNSRAQTILQELQKRGMKVNNGG